MPLHPLASLQLILETVSLCQPCPMSMAMSAKALVAPLSVFGQRVPCMCCANFSLYATKGFRRSLCSAHTNVAKLDKHLYNVKHFPTFANGNQVLYQVRDETDPAHGQWFPAEIQTTTREGYVHLNFIEFKLKVVEKKKQEFNVRELIQDGQLAHIGMLEDKCFKNGKTGEAYYQDLFPCVTCPSVAHRTCFEEGCVTNLDLSISPELRIDDSEVVYQCQPCVSMHKSAHDIVRPSLSNSVGVNDYVSVRRGETFCFHVHCMYNMCIFCVCVYALIYIAESSYLIIRLGESQHCYCFMCVYAYLNVYCRIVLPFHEVR